MPDRFASRAVMSAGRWPVRFDTPNVRRTSAPAAATVVSSSTPRACARRTAISVSTVTWAVTLLPVPSNGTAARSVPSGVAAPLTSSR